MKLEKYLAGEFDEIYTIMEQSFPEDERRTYEQQKALLNENSYSIYVYKENKKVISFISVWQFDGFSYIEHFAVNGNFRNRGLGAKMLTELVPKLSGIVCLEAELPETEMAVRRIGFYERNGFFTNDYPYVQPPYSKEKNPVDLLIMTYGRKINENEFENIKNNLYKKVYNVKE